MRYRVKIWIVESWDLLGWNGAFWVKIGHFMWANGPATGRIGPPGPRGSHSHSLDFGGVRWRSEHILWKGVRNATMPKGFIISLHKTNFQSVGTKYAKNGQFRDSLRPRGANFGQKCPFLDENLQIRLHATSKMTLDLWIFYSVGPWNFAYLVPTL